MNTRTIPSTAIIAAAVFKSLMQPQHLSTQGILFRGIIIKKGVKFNKIEYFDS